MSNEGSIYIIKNLKNDKVYVGQTILTLKERFREHLVASKIDSNCHIKLYKAMKEIGIENFYIECLESHVAKEELCNREKYYIEQYGSYRDGYNATIGGKGGELIEEKNYPKILMRYRAGESCSEIAKDFNISHVTIYRILVSQGVQLRHDGNKFEYFPRDLFIAMWNNKRIKRKDMAKFFNVDARTIKRYASRLGLGRKASIPHNKIIED